MKKIYLFVFSFLLVLNSDFASAQFNTKSVSDLKMKLPENEGGRAQNVFVEVGGQGLLFTANYDSRFSNSRDGLGGRVGIGYISADGDNATTIPFALNYLLGKGKQFFEVGAGATVIASKTTGSFFFEDNDTVHKNSTVIGTMSFSYRLQPVESGFSFRAGLTPIFNGDFFLPYYGGLSLGYTF